MDLFLRKISPRSGEFLKFNDIFMNFELFLWKNQREAARILLMISFTKKQSAVFFCLAFFMTFCKKHCL